MIGTFVNMGTILLGSLLGGLVKRIISDRINQCLFNAMGLAAFGLGINAVVQNMPDSRYPVLFIASLAIGGVIGTLLDLDGRVGRLTSNMEKSRPDPAEGPEGPADATGESADAPEGIAEVAEGPGGTPQAADTAQQTEAGRQRPRLGEGLVTGSLLFCVGTLSILGPVQSALYQDHTFLYTNAMLDLVTSMVLASTYGIGMCLAAGVLLVWQGSIYGLTVLCGDFISGTMMTELSIVGGFLIAMSGLAILDIKDCRTLNFLPALFVPVIWCLAAGRLF